MNRRMLAWKTAGSLVFAGAVTWCHALAGSVAVIPLVLLALMGLPLVVHGDRVPRLLNAERHGHGATLAAIHKARSARFVDDQYPGQKE